jgi:hypothetical protein
MRKAQVVSEQLSVLGELWACTDREGGGLGSNVKWPHTAHHPRDQLEGLCKWGHAFNKYAMVAGRGKLSKAA